jgi:hypothetical protein
MARNQSHQGKFVGRMQIVEQRGSLVTANQFLLKNIYEGWVDM